MPDQLRLLQQLSRLTQTELAREVGVSFVTLNRWLHSKAVPHPKSAKRISDILSAYTGHAGVPDEALKAKKEAVFLRAREGPDPLTTILSRRDIRDHVVLVLTFTSNSIEGSTLTEDETQAVLFENASPSDRTVTEVLEAKNHQTALMLLFDYLAEDGKIDESLILHLHSTLMNGILPDAGRYRHHAVRIVGANIPTANYLSVPSSMSDLLASVVTSPPDTLAHVARVHARFEQIHPFSDGNGRIGRLLMQAMLIRAAHPPAIIRPQRKRLYYAALRQAQVGGDDSLLQDFLCDAVLEGSNCLSSVEPGSAV